MKITEAIPFVYNKVNSFYEGLALVRIDDKWGFIDNTGTMVISCKKYNFSHLALAYTCFGKGFSDGLAAIQVAGGNKYGEYGFIDKLGNEVISPVYDAVRDFSCGAAIVGIVDGSLGQDADGTPRCKWGAINKNGDEIIPIGKYKRLGGNPEYCRDNPGVGDTIHDGNARKFYEGMAFVYPWGNDNESSKYGFADTLGNEILPPIYAYDESSRIYRERFYNGLSNVSFGYGKQQAAIDKTGKIVFQHNYYHMDYFYDEITRAYNIKPYEIFFIDKKGNQPFTLPLKYSGADAFHEGMALVCIGSGNTFKFKRGFIDINGQEIVPCKYDNAKSYYDGIAVVGMGDYRYGKKGAVDKQGREFIPCKYDQVDQLGHGLVEVCIQRREKRGYAEHMLVESKCGIYDTLGQEIVPPIYDAIRRFCEGMAAVRKGEKWGFIKIDDIGSA